MNSHVFLILKAKLVQLYEYFLNTQTIQFLIFTYFSDDIFSIINTSFLYIYIFYIYIYIYLYIYFLYIFFKKQSILFFMNKLIITQQEMSVN